MWNVKIVRPSTDADLHQKEMNRLILLSMVTQQAKRQMNMLSHIIVFSRLNTDHSKLISCNYLYLTRSFISINVEWAYGDETAKYVTKYAMKGVDMAFVAVKSREGVANVDEFHELNLARYVTSQEAMMAIFGMSLVKLSHPVSQLIF